MLWNGSEQDRNVRGGECEECEDGKGTESGDCDTNWLRQKASDMLCALSM